MFIVVIVVVNCCFLAKPVAQILPNKLNEPEFKLTIDPPTGINFKGDKITEEVTVFDLKITNTTDKRQTYKVRNLYYGKYGKGLEEWFPSL